MGLAYWRAPLEIWSMTGAFSSSQASIMAWRSSMLFTLKAPIAYLPLSALEKRSLVCVSGIIDFCQNRLSFVVLGQFSIQRGETDLKQFGRFFLVTAGVGQSAV